MFRLFWTSKTKQMSSVHFRWTEDRKHNVCWHIEQAAPVHPDTHIHTHTSLVNQGPTMTNTLRTNVQNQSEPIKKIGTNQNQSSFQKKTQGSLQDNAYYVKSKWNPHICAT